MSNVPALDPLDASALARAHPLTQFGLDALAAGAARPRPGALALQDHGVQDHDQNHPAAFAYAEMDMAIGAFAARLRDFQFARGERILLVCAPASRALIALTAMVREGIAPVLAPPHLTQDALAAAARAVSAAAILAPARFAGLNLEETLLAVAARTPGLRLLGTLGGGTLDGAVDFSPGALKDGASNDAAASAGAPPRARPHDGWTRGEGVAIGAADESGAVVFLPQGALLGHALDLVRATRKGGAAPALSLVSPGSFSGLIAGPLAALLAGAPLHFLAPFGAAAFLALLDAIGPARLVAPAAILPDLFRAGLLTSGALVCVTALSKRGAAPIELDAANACSMGACPIVEIISGGAAIELRDFWPRDVETSASHDIRRGMSRDMIRNVGKDAA